jgi:hypothetical protein
VEATVLRTLSFVAVLGWFLGVSPAVRAQDAQPAEQPSVADAARQARKDKDKDKNATATKTVITDDNLGNGTAAIAAAGTSKSGGATPAVSGPSDKKASLDQAHAGLEAAEASLDMLEPLGKKELATTVLKGNTADFPGRSDWEQRLYSAKGVYIVRSRQLITSMKQTLADMEALQGDPKVTPNDPRVQELSRKTQEIMQLAARTENAFQQIVKEGQNLAGQAPPK